MFLSQELWYKLSRFHQLAGSTEWSGPIWYTVTGGLDTPDKMIINVTDFMLKDIGSSAYTEYISIVDTDELNDVKILKGKVLIAVAAHFGGVRLIDNVIITIGRK